VKRCLFILALALFVLGCRSNDAVLHLQIWHQMRPEDRALLEHAVKEYSTAHKNVIVEVIYKETEELRSGFQSAALAGFGPELIYGPSDQVGPLATMQFIQPLETLLPAARLAEFDTMALVWYRGHLFQAADRVGNHLALVYNTKLLPVPPKNTDELIAAAQKCTIDKNGDGKVDEWGIVWNFTEPYFFVPWLSGFGGWVFDAQGKPSLNTPAAVNAFRFVKSLRDEYHVIPPDCDYSMADALFKEGRAAMLINGPWSWPGYEQSGVPYELARIPQVTVTGLWPAPMVSPLGYSINVHATGRRLEETVKLLEFLLSDSVQRRFVIANGVIPSSRALRKDSSYLSRPHMANSLAQLEVGRPMPVVPELRAVWDAMRPAYQSVLGGKVSPEAAAAQMQKDAEAKIREMNE
jgi:arabinogalactan oligomer / maltooligosaccharide transport system permease protein